MSLLNGRIRVVLGDRDRGWGCTRRRPRRRTLAPLPVVKEGILADEEKRSEDDYTPGKHMKRLGTEEVVDFGGSAACGTISFVAAPVHQKSRCVLESGLVAKTRAANQRPRTHARTLPPRAPPQTWRALPDAELSLLRDFLLAPPRLAPRRLPEHLGYIPARIRLLTTGKPLPHLGRRLRAILPCTSAALTHLMVLAIYALADLGGPAPCATRGVLHQRTVYASRAWDGAEEGEVQEIWESKEQFRLITRPWRERGVAWTTRAADNVMHGKAGRVGYIAPPRTRAIIRRGARAASAHVFCDLANAPSYCDMARSYCDSAGRPTPIVYLNIRLTADVTAPSSDRVAVNHRHHPRAINSTITPAIIPPLLVIAEPSRLY
ncbi:hypothetical protein C8J57DRAFT_1469949 [Mycena rebaudengoi]|nr:hypothetical protein C8J57DRAFT_1469949 [Mycena rebaudengoi]